MSERMSGGERIKAWKEEAAQSRNDELEARIKALEAVAHEPVVVVTEQEFDALVARVARLEATLRAAIPPA